MDEIKITISTGEELTLREAWKCCEGYSDCGSVIEVYDDTDTLMCELSGSLPDTDDEDFDMDEFTNEIEERIDCEEFGNYPFEIPSDEFGADYDDDWN